MILGIGTDIVDVERIKKKISKGEDFKRMVFSEGEIKYCENLKNKFESYAARFAAKEAFLKAIGTGLLIDFDLKEIEVTNLSSGMPILKISENVFQKVIDIFGSSFYCAPFLIPYITNGFGFHNN